MKKVLIIAYSFPPVGGAGVQRPVKFVKYLQKFGWEPVVLTVSNPSVPLIDTTLPKDIPEGVQIYRALTFEPSYKVKHAFADNQGKRSGAKVFLKRCISMLLLPDLQVLWWPGLIFKLFKVIINEKPLCLFVTAPPFSSFIPVITLGKLFGIPVVLDFRDEWEFSRNSWENSSKTQLASCLDVFLEKYALTNCSAFTTATQGYIDSMTNHYGPTLKVKGVVITNGYDVDDFNVTEIKGRAIEDSNRVTIVYAGTVMKATSLNIFCQILKRLLEQDEKNYQKVRLKVFGRVVGDEQTCLEDETLKGVIECHGYVEHEKVAEELLNADFLLLTLSDLPGAEKIINGKTFEYMASGRHIFALIPEGEMSALISSNYDNATVVSPKNLDVACQALINVLDNIEEVKKRQGRDISCFLRENLTERLASVFDRIVNDNS